MDILVTPENVLLLNMWFVSDMKRNVLRRISTNLKCDFFMSFRLSWAYIIVFGA